jgi:hypothetical protein
LGNPDNRVLLAFFFIFSDMWVAELAAPSDVARSIQFPRDHSLEVAIRAGRFDVLEARWWRPVAQRAQRSLRSFKIAVGVLARLDLIRRGT